MCVACEKIINPLITVIHLVPIMQGSYSSLSEERPSVDSLSDIVTRLSPMGMKDKFTFAIETPGKMKTSVTICPISCHNPNPAIPDLEPSNELIKEEITYIEHPVNQVLVFRRQSRDQAYFDEEFSNTDID